MSPVPGYPLGSFGARMRLIWLSQKRAREFAGATKRLRGLREMEEVVKCLSSLSRLRLPLAIRET